MNDDFKEELKDAYAEIDALRAEVEDLKERLRAARELTARGGCALDRATDLRVKNWRGGK